MALTAKQTRQLRALANRLKPLLIIGRNDLTDASVEQADAVLQAHELVKCSVLEGSELTAKDAAGQLAERVHAEVVQVIGNRFVLFRRSTRDDIEHIALARN